MRPAAAKRPKIRPNNILDESSSVPTGDRAMSKEAPLSIAERDFILEALRQDARLDGRTANQFRPLKISFGDEYGHVNLELGNTRYEKSQSSVVAAN